MSEVLTEQKLIEKVNQVITNIELYQTNPSDTSLKRIKLFLTTSDFLRFSIYAK